MKLLVCIDDTDNLDKTISTGKIAEIILADIEKNGWGKCEAVTRHQLLVHEDIPYTSHNSSMCFRVYTESIYYERIVQRAIELLYEYQAEGSDPGLAVLKEEELKNKDLLIEYGYNAKRIILTKEIAYDLAKTLDIHLTEHGGTGLGVIGALAGTGLRLSGDDGEFKGTVKIGEGRDRITVKELEEYPFIDEVRLINGDEVNKESIILLGKKYKTILKGGKAVFLVEYSDEENNYRSCTKKEIRAYDK